jgi:hypothetical protein
MLLETILGGVTGLIGNIVGGIFKYKTAKLQADHDENMIKLETEAMVTEAKANIAITRATVEGEIEIADSKAYMHSQIAGNKALFGQKWVDKLLSVEGRWKILTLPVAILVAFLFGFVDFARGFMRPALTGYLVGMSTFITIWAYRIMSAEGITLNAEQAVKIFEDTTSIIVYLTVSCVTWWFGDRRMAKTIMQLKGADRTKIDDDITI